MSLGRIFGPACAGFLLDIKISYPYLSCVAIMLIGFLASIIWLEREPLSLNRTHIEPVLNLTADTFLEKSS